MKLKEKLTYHVCDGDFYDVDEVYLYTHNIELSHHEGLNQTAIRIPKEDIEGVIKILQNAKKYL